jgi:hypothetical protein
MSRIAAALVALSLGFGRLAAQRVPLSQPLDSGTVVRLTWDSTKQVGRLLAPLEPRSTAVVYCRFPGPACRQLAASPAEARSVQHLVRVEVPEGSQAGRGALIGAGVSAVALGLGRLAFADRDSPAPWTGQRVAAAVTFVGLAAGVGALIGRGSARWVAAP